MSIQLLYVIIIYFYLPFNTSIVLFLYCGRIHYLFYVFFFHFMISGKFPPIFVESNVRNISLLYALAEID